MNDQQVEQLQRRIQRLTTVVVGMVGLCGGAVLMGSTRPASSMSAPPCCCSPQPAGAPEGGFVVVPTANGAYATISAPGLGVEASGIMWRYQPEAGGEREQLLAKAAELEAQLHQMADENGKVQEPGGAIMVQLIRIQKRLDELDALDAQNR